MGVKIKDILKTVKIGTEVGKLFVPGAAGKVLDIVNRGLDPDDSMSQRDALKEFAAKVDETNDEQTAAILALHERVKVLEAKLKK